MPNLEHLIEDGRLVLAGEFSMIREANEHALVVLAMNLECWVRMNAEEDQYGIYVEPAFELAVKEEFKAYAIEQSEDQGPQELPAFASGIELAFFWVMSLLVIFGLQRYLVKRRGDVTLREHQDALVLDINSCRFCVAWAIRILEANLPIDGRLVFASLWLFEKVESA